MKRLKRLAALALSAVMALSLAAPAFATEGDPTDPIEPSNPVATPPGMSQTGTEGSITITQYEKNSTYTAYQVFAAVTNGKDFTYIVEKDSIWYDFVTKKDDENNGEEFVDVDESQEWTINYSEWRSALALLDENSANNTVTGYLVKWKDYDEGTDAEVQKAADAAEFASRAMAYYSAHRDKYTVEENLKWRGRSGSVQTGNSSGGAQEMVTYGIDRGVTIEDLPYGYYLVDSTTGALCALTTAKPNATLEDKNAPKSLIKQIWDGNGAPDWSAPTTGKNTGWTQGIDANVGDHLYFRTVFKPGKGQENLVLKDLVMGRMTVNMDNIRIFDKNGNLVEGTDYRIFWGTEDDDYRAVTKSDDSNKSDKMALMNRIEHALYNYWTFGIIFSNERIRTYNKDDTITVCYEANLDNDAYLVQYGDAAGTAINDKGILTYVGSHDNIAILGSAGGTTTEFDALVESSEGELPWYKGTENAKVKVDEILEKGKVEDGDLDGVYADVLTSTASVNVSGFSVVKTDGQSKVLKGAKFKLYYDEACTQEVPLSLTTYTRTENKNYTIGEGADAAEVGLAPERTIYSYQGGSSSEISTKETGTAAIVGLEAGDYWLKETEAPGGYNKLEAPQKITLLSYWDFLGSMNLTDAESQIRDTDMSHEMMEYNKNNILAQAAQSMLSARSQRDLSSGYRINRAGDDAAGQAISEQMRSRIRGMNQAWMNLEPIQVNGTGSINLKNYGWSKEDLYVTPARSFFTEVTETAADGTEESVWYYGQTDGIKLQIGPSAGQTVQGTEGSPLCGGVQIINLTGIELPHTGGMGTTIFYVVGGLLVVGAGVLLIVKKRMKDEE